MADRFGNNFSAGVDFSVKKKNWIFTADADYIFGNQIKDDSFLNSLKSSSGYFTGVDGHPAQILLYERGYSLTVVAGKLFPLGKHNVNSGLLFQAGGGFIQHKIRIEDADGVFPQLDGDYKKGYDHLTNGFCLQQSLGFFHLDKMKLKNFRLDFEFIEGFTVGRRNWNFETMSADTQPRLDVLMGFRLTWMLSFYSQNTAQVYFY